MDDRPEDLYLVHVFKFFTAGSLTQVAVVPFRDRGSWVSRNAEGGLGCLEIAVGPVSLTPPAWKALV